MKCRHLWWDNMKKIIAIILLLVMVKTFVSCKEGEKMEFLSKNELISVCNEKGIEYEGVDLEKFIEDYELTNENIDDYNLGILIDEYSNLNNSINVFSTVFDVRDDSFALGIRSISFYENKNTSTKSAYIDFTSLSKVVSTNEYIFDNFSNYQKEKVSKYLIDELSSFVSETIATTWKSTDSTDIYDDGYSIKLVVLYEDKTAVTISCSGIFNDFELPNYDEFIKLLFN